MVFLYIVLRPKKPALDGKIMLVISMSHCSKISELGYRVHQKCLEDLLSLHLAELVPLSIPLLLLGRAAHLYLSLPLLQTGLDSLLLRLCRIHRLLKGEERERRYPLSLSPTPSLPTPDIERKGKGEREGGRRRHGRRGIGEERRGVHPLT